MKRPAASVIRVLASVLLGTLSYWLYHLLRERGLFAAQSAWRAVVVITIAALLIVLWVLLSHLHRGEGNAVGHGGSGCDWLAAECGRRGAGFLVSCV